MTGLQHFQLEAGKKRSVLFQGFGFLYNRSSENWQKLENFAF